MSKIYLFDKSELNNYSYLCRWEKCAYYTRLWVGLNYACKIYITMRLVRAKTFLKHVVFVYKNVLLTVVKMAFESIL